MPAERELQRSVKIQMRARLGALHMKPDDDNHTKCNDT